MAPKWQCKWKKKCSEMTLNLVFITETEIVNRSEVVLKLSHAWFYCICIVACKNCHGHSFIIPHTQLSVWCMLLIWCFFFPSYLPFFLLIYVFIHNWCRCCFFFALCSLLVSMVTYIGLFGTCMYYICWLYRVFFVIIFVWIVLAPVNSCL